MNRGVLAVLLAVVVPVAVGAAQSGAEQAILDAVTALEAAGPYRVVQRGGGAETVLEVVPPDRLRVRLGSLETVTVGARSWTKLNGTWTEQPGGAAPAPGLSREGLADGLITNPQHLGTEEVGGTPAEVYRFEGEATTEGVSASQVAKLWVGVADGLPLRLDSTVTVQGVITETSMTYEYDDTIVIEAPTP